ncbi:MAG: hypothetical protein AAF281_00500 [Pseudomonadota bacterium]
MRLAAALLAATIAPLPALAAGERVTISGEVIDTWCYFSGVMGPPDSVTGSAHHTCAMWCAAGGIPVGVLAEDGTVYMVMKWQDETGASGGGTILSVQSDSVTASGDLYERDGINYLVVADVVDNSGLVNQNHDEWGVVPPFAIPKSAKP